MVNVVAAELQHENTVSVSLTEARPAAVKSVSPQVLFTFTHLSDAFIQSVLQVMHTASPDICLYITVFLLLCILEKLPGNVRMKTSTCGVARPPDVCIVE